MTRIERTWIGIPTIRSLVGCAAIAAFAAILLAGCGGKGSRNGARQTGRPDSSVSAGAHGSGTGAPGAAPGTPGANPGTPGDTSSAAPELPDAAKRYGYDRAAEYVRNLQERVAKVTKRLDDIERLIRATEAPQTAEMDARLQTLRAIGEDITSRSVDAENSATEMNWTAWQASLEKEMGNLDHGAARLDTMVTAVRRSP